MKKPGEKNEAIRYGITPAAVVEFGWLVLVGTLLAASAIYHLISWLE